MSVLTEGTVTAPPAIRTHTEPTTTVEAGELPGDSDYVHDYGDYVNTGNVPQTLNVTVSDVVGCSVVLVKAVVNGSVTDLPATLQAGQGCKVRVIAKTNAQPVGSDPVAFSFTLSDGVWA